MWTLWHTHAFRDTPHRDCECLLLFSHLLISAHQCDSMCTHTHTDTAIYKERTNSCLQRCVGVELIWQLLVCLLDFIGPPLAFFHFIAPSYCCVCACVCPSICCISHIDIGQFKKNLHGVFNLIEVSFNSIWQEVPGLICGSASPNTVCSHQDSCQNLSPCNDQLNIYKVHTCTHHITDCTFPRAEPIPALRRTWGHTVGSEGFGQKDFIAS